MPNYDIGLVSQNRGEKYQPSNESRVFTGGNQAVVATALSAGVGTTYTGGLMLYNPLSSTVQVSISSVSACLLSSQTNVTALNVSLGSSAVAPTGTLTAVTSVCANVAPGSTTLPQAKLYSSASITLPAAPVVAKPLGSFSKFGGSVDVDLAGQIILQPGGYAVFTSTAAGTASSSLFSFTWEEMAPGAQ